MIKYIYSVFLGLLLAIFIGVGISVFYQPPAEPKYPNELNYSQQKEPTTDQREAEKVYGLKMEVWNKQMEPYHRNVSIIALIAAVILIGIGMLMGDKLRILADGVMLGGVFTLVYSLIQGFMSNNTKYSFMVVTVALIAVITLGYLKLIKPHEKTAKVES